MRDPSEITYEKGYARLKDIAERVNSDEVPVHEMCDLFAEGKGLDAALSSYLEEQKGRVEQIERGEGIQPFRIVPPSDEVAEHREAQPPDGRNSEPGPPSSGDDDIPF